MKIHLVPSHDLNDELYARVLSLLQAIPGVNKFFAAGPGQIILPEDMREDQEIPDKDAFEKIELHNFMVRESDMSQHLRSWSFPHFRQAIPWNELFSAIQQFRNNASIPSDQFIILLTPTANKQNWFAAIDEKHPYNGFIHTDEWDHYMSCDPALPIAFEVIALILQKHIFANYRDVRLYTHDRAIGCISDMCMHKRDIILKMRTADICPDCLQKVQTHLSTPEIHHALNIIETLRLKMLFAQNFRQNSPPSRLAIRRGGRIYLTDYGNLEIRMHTMEKALYILFLKYPEGIYLSALADHREELYDIYCLISTRGLREDMIRRIDDMTNILRDQLSVKISRIKRAFTDAIGATLADHYIIQGENAEKKRIKLDRGLVE